ncbi:MAG: MalY/PatB family protein [Paracoccaceae bacterium]|uniref:MalY/PatB family protein n=1 Tax=Candidatus Salinivivens marinus TaxID=3381703 RepID=UPI000B62ADF1|nr:aminotransferase [Marinovum sp.]OUU13769.1 MAG: aminotransferase [Rhodobacteraceae bacterium TMED38]PDH59740.1 MAG: aminotransferase [Rhodobacteraceae bacterium MED-G08]|tara:strand:+ start:7432 stop:8604 length:1173 start_codon:yes stop_codon:yes gene_type:complete
MDFDEVIDRRGTHSSKWDTMEELYGVSPDTGLSMWVADMDFRAPEIIQEKLRGINSHGIYGYYGDHKEYNNSIKWWMKNRHNWEIDTSWIFTTHGLVNGTGLCIDAFSKPGDGIILFTPVYYQFSNLVEAAGRKVLECPLKLIDNQYHFNFVAYERNLSGDEKMVILCSPHNPGGRVWTKNELQEVAKFAKKHDLVLVSDEIHHDLVYPNKSHTVMPIADPYVCDRLVMMTATTKTFNIAGAHSGNVIISNPNLRQKFSQRIKALGISPNSFGLFMATAAYSPEGAQWLDELMHYIDGNRVIFDREINKIPGLSSMPLEGTYLAWVDFSGTGMEEKEFIYRVQEKAKIAVNHGSTFGTGGEKFLRFNLATPRTLVVEATKRLKDAFSDLQ